MLQRAPFLWTERKELHSAAVWSTHALQLENSCLMFQSVLQIRIRLLALMRIRIPKIIRIRYTGFSTQIYFFNKICVMDGTPVRYPYLPTSSIGNRYLFIKIKPPFLWEILIANHSVFEHPHCRKEKGNSWRFTLHQTPAGKPGQIDSFAISLPAKTTIRPHCPK